MGETNSDETYGFGTRIEETTSKRNFKQRGVVCSKILLTWLLDVFLPWSDVSAGHAFLTWFLDVFIPWSDVSAGRAFLTWFIQWSYISVEDDKDLHEG